MSTKKIIALVMIFLGVSLIAGFGIYSVVRHRQPSAGLKVDASPSSLVFVDDVEVGSTPVDKLFFPGEATVKLIPNSTSSALSTYQTKVNLTEKTYTVIKRDFGNTDSDSAGEIVSLQSQSDPAPSLSVITSSPDTASILVDGQPQGFAPLSVASIAPGNHQVTVTAPGFVPRTVSVQTVNNYKLVLTIKLAASAVTTTPTPTLEPTPTATPSATPRLKATPTPSPTPSPTPKAKPTPIPTPEVLLPKPYVTILDTPTGFLRVRETPSLGGTEVGQVKPGQSYPLLNSGKADWYEIKVQLDATSSGWISSQYAKKYQ